MSTAPETREENNEAVKGVGDLCGNFSDSYRRCFDFLS